MTKKQVKKPAGFEYVRYHSRLSKTYLINRKGTVYHIRRNKVIKVIRPYMNFRTNRLKVNLTTFSKAPVNVDVLLLCTFRPVENSKKRKIWYRDGNPRNLKLSNIDWVE